MGVGLAPLFPKGPGGAANRDMFKPFGGASSVAKEPIQDWRRILPLVKSLTANDLIRICGIGDADEAEAMRFAEWGARDPAAAIAAAGGNFLLIEQAAWAAAETQPEVAVELLKPFTTPPFRVFDGDVDRLISEFFELWANNDHDAAKRALQDDHWKSLADGKDFELLDDLTRGVGKYWPEDNPAGWVRWMAEFAVDGRDDFSYFTRAVSWGRPQSHKVSDIGQLVGMHNPVARDAAIAEVCQGLSDLEKIKALEAVSSENRVFIASRIAEAIENPMDALRWFAEQAPSQRPASESFFSKDGGAGMIIQRWAGTAQPISTEEFQYWPGWLQEDIAGFRSVSESLAADTALAIVEPQQRSPAVVEVPQWGAKDPAMASDWLSALDSGSDRDAAAAGLVYGSVTSDPGGALAWAKSVSDKTLRERSLRLAISVIADRDPAAARFALDSAQVSVEARVSLMRYIQSKEEEAN